MSLRIGVVGATGAVGRKMLDRLEARSIPISELRCFSSARSAGQVLQWKDKKIEVEALTESVMKESFDYLLFSAGGDVAKHFAPIASEAGNMVIDNSSCWRMEEGIPLVVPEINGHVLTNYRGIVANPNCSTIQMVMALNPLHHQYGLKQIVVSTYQAVSGSGQKAIEELNVQQQDPTAPPAVYPQRIAGNCLPHIDAFQENGFTKEEMKMIRETHKILGEPKIPINATAVRVPVVYGHSESVTVTLCQEPDLEEVRELMIQSPGIVLEDDPAHLVYPTPLTAAGTDATYVGRIRRDLFDRFTLSLWVVADNLHKGAATNAIQILEFLEGIHHPRR